MPSKKDESQDQLDLARFKRKNEWDYGYIKAEIQVFIASMSDDKLAHVMKWAIKDAKRLKLKTAIFRPSYNDVVDGIAIEVIVNEFQRRKLNLD